MYNCMSDLVTSDVPHGVPDGNALNARFGICYIFASKLFEGSKAFSVGFTSTMSVCYGRDTNFYLINTDHLPSL